MQTDAYNSHLRGYELLRDVLLEKREQSPEPPSLFPEQRRFCDAAGEQRANDHSAVLEALVHLAHHQHVAHLRVLVRLQLRRGGIMCWGSGTGWAGGRRTQIDMK